MANKRRAFSAGLEDAKEAPPSTSSQYATKEDVQNIIESIQADIAASITKVINAKVADTARKIDAVFSDRIASVEEDLAKNNARTDLLVAEQTSMRKDIDQLSQTLRIADNQNRAPTIGELDYAREHRPNVSQVGFRIAADIKEATEYTEKLLKDAGLEPVDFIIFAGEPLRRQDQEYHCHVCGPRCSRIDECT